MFFQELRQNDAEDSQEDTIARFARGLHGGDLIAPDNPVSQEDTIARFAWGLRSMDLVDFDNPDSQADLHVASS